MDSAEDVLARLDQEARLRQRAEEAFALNEARLDGLLTLSEKHESSVEELAQFVIDEAVRLTRSSIGYLHFVNEGEDGFLSYFWSTNSRETCSAVNMMDYKLAHAGIWADALRLRHPVIHNDYPNEPSRQGLPPGHHPLSRHMCIPVLREGKVVAICGVANKAEHYDASDQRQLALLANRLWSIVESKRANAALAAANAELSRIASLDALTGVANRRGLMSHLESQWKRAIREERSISLLMIDIDFFKLFNDRYGHQAGDQALKSVGEAVASAARRSTDLAARYGGEEFVLVLPATRKEFALEIAERLVEKVRRLGIAHEASKCAAVVTISIGVASCLPRSEIPIDYETLIAEADEALYAAKNTGRNRACTA